MLSPVYTHAVLEPVAHGWTIPVPPAPQPYHDQEHPSLGVNDRERPPGDFPPALNFSVEAKIRAGSFCPVHKRACSSLGSRDSGTNGTRRLTTATGRARKVFAFEAGCGRIAAGCHRIWGGPVPARHIYSRFKDVSETVLAHRPAAVTHYYTVLRRSTYDQSRLWEAIWRLSRGQGTLANGSLTVVRRSLSGHVVFIKTVCNRLWFSLFVHD